MPTLEVVERYLWWLAIAGHLVLYLRLRQLGLTGTYRFFSFYLVFRTVRSLLLEATPLLLMAMGRHPNGRFASTAYGWTWAATEPLVWVTYVLVVLELCNLVFQKYKGIASLGRWVVMGALAVAVVISSLTLGADLSNPNEQFPILLYFLAISRGVLTSLVIFLLFLAGFLVWYPVPLGRNVITHAIIYAVYFLSLTMALLVRNLSGSAMTQAVNLAMSGVTIGCLGAWLSSLTKRGELTATTVRPRWDPGRQEQIMEQMASVNSSLLRAARK